MVAKESLKEKYIKYLIKELEIRYKQDYLNDIKTIYIGGGTPSSLNSDLLEELLTKIESCINLDKVVEYTFEANPSDISYNLAKILKNHRINRVSLGVQSLDKDKLLFLGRNHTKENVINAITILQNVKIYNINADLIYGVNDENFGLIKKDLKILSKMDLTHFSVYSLILEEKTILKQKFTKGEFKIMNSDKERKLYYKIVKYLHKLGYHQYEVSNFSKQNFESVHNLTYWNNEHYLGIGSNASYYIDDTRYTNINNLEKYFLGIDIKDLIYSEKNLLTEKDKIAEEIILGFRKTKGISLTDFKNKYNKDFFEVYPITNDLIANKYLTFKDNFLAISPKYVYIMNEILLKFL